MRAFFLKLDNKYNIRAICSYGIIGGLSAAISFSSFALLWNVFHIHYKIAVTISYILAILFNFSCNRFFTFKSSGCNLTKHIYRYLSMIALNYTLTMLIVHIAVESLSLSPYIGLVAAAAVTTLTGFTLSKFWVFRIN